MFDRYAVAIGRHRLWDRLIAGGRHSAGVIQEVRPGQLGIGQPVTDYRVKLCVELSGPVSEEEARRLVFPACNWVNHLGVTPTPDGDTRVFVSLGMRDNPPQIMLDPHQLGGTGSPVQDGLSYNFYYAEPIRPVYSLAGAARLTDHGLTAPSTMPAHHFSYWAVGDAEVHLTISFNGEVPRELVESRLADQLGDRLTAVHWLEQGKVRVELALGEEQVRLGFLGLRDSRGAPVAGDGLVIDRARSVRLLSWSEENQAELYGEPVLPGQVMRAGHCALRDGNLLLATDIIREGGELDDRRVLWLVDGRTGDARPLAGAVSLRQAYWLPDERRILVACREGAFVLDPLGDRRDLPLDGRIVVGTAAAQDGRLAILAMNQAPPAAPYPVDLLLFNTEGQQCGMHPDIVHHAGRAPGGCLEDMQPIWKDDTILVVESTEDDRLVRSIELATGSVEPALFYDKTVARCQRLHYDVLAVSPASSWHILTPAGQEAHHDRFSSNPVNPSRFRPLRAMTAGLLMSEDPCDQAGAVCLWSPETRQAVSIGRGVVLGCDGQRVIYAGE